MNYQITDSLDKADNNCIVTGFLIDEKPDFIKSLDTKYQTIAKKLIDKLPEKSSHIWQGEYEDSSILIFNLGERKDYNLKAFAKYVKKIIDKVLQHKIKNIVIYLPAIKDVDANQQLKHLILNIEEAKYQFLEYKSEKKKHELEKIAIKFAGADKKAIDEALCIAQGLKLTKDLANMPANICTPSYLAQEAIELAKTSDKLHAKILHREEMLKLGMGALLAVAQGSKEPPQLIELHYQGAAKDDKPLVLVGKGITFDSGGISIKPAELMNEMKFDMSGAATVFGVIKACALLQLPVNIVGLMPTAENMPGGNATKPGDIVHTMQGTTVEITNTDAEGRLILADALTYAKQFSPKMILDIATLTGAMIISLGRVMTGFMTNDDEISELLLKAQEESLDRAWRLPLDEDYKDALDSPIADLNNCPADRAAGSITAAQFLANFTKEYRWAHLDIAGTAWVSGRERRATGRPVQLLVQFVQQLI